MKNKIISILKRIKFYLGNVWRFFSYPFMNQKVKIEDISNIFACSFGLSGWHPLVETLKEYEQNPQISYKDTTLYKYHKNFTPKDTADALLGNSSPEIPLFEYPWGTFLITQVSNKSPETSRFCGPSTDSFIQEEFNRTLKLYKNIKENGYNPWSYKNSFIGGTILKSEKGGNRFIVMQGNHRCAVLSVLGYKEISIRKSPKLFISLVQLSNMSSWPYMRKNESQSIFYMEIFNAFFNNDGTHIKKRIED